MFFLKLKNVYQAFLKPRDLAPTYLKSSSTKVNFTSKRVKTMRPMTAIACFTLLTPRIN